MADEKREEGIGKGLAWPPRKEDLERLYLEQRLSAAKIAKFYGLRYANPKTAESTVLYHLKKNGISRRDPAEHVRKVSEGMVDGWIIRYQKGESLKQIAGDAINPVTVFNHLHKRGLQLRDKVEAQTVAITIHQRLPFSGDLSEMAYLTGLTAGDLGIAKHGRAVRVKLSTTHPEMERLFRTLFSAHGPVYKYPRPNEIVGHQWAFDCDLDSSFEFLYLAKANQIHVPSDEKLFLCFLSGFFDAEGSIYYHKKGNGGSFEVSITNTDLALQQISTRLEQLGVHHVLRRSKVDRKNAIESGMTNPSEFMWKIVVWRHRDVNWLLSTMTFRHPEKRAKSRIALNLGFRASHEDRAKVEVEWKSLTRQILLDCRDYIAGARTAWETKLPSKRKKKTSLTPVDPI